MRYDIAIIGTGPAGLEAAITAKVRNKNILLLGSADLSPKVREAHTIRNYLGLPEAGGEKLADVFRDHLDAMGIEITEDRINTVYAMGNYFALQGHRADYEAATVILAAGMSMVTTFAGETELLGRGVSYCATCDAALYKGKSAVVVAYAEEDLKEAEFLAERAAKVMYLPQYEGAVKSPAKKLEVRPGIRPVEIRREDGHMVLVDEDGDTITADGIFVLREQVAPATLVPGLAMEDSHVAVDRHMRTNLPGLFACGDITGAPYQYIKAAGEGNVAALSAVSYLASEAGNRP